MRFSTFTVYDINLPLKSKVQIFSRKTSNRTGVVLKLTDKNGNFAWGEHFPLIIPGSAALQSIKSDISALAADLINKELNFDNSNFKFFLNSTDEVDFGGYAHIFEMALLQLIAQQKDISLQKLLNPNAGNIVKINGLITGAEKNTDNAVKRMISSGFDTIKIKTGSGNPEEDVQMVRYIADKLPQNIKIRLDANRAWTYHGAINFCSIIAGLNIEYIEEPLQNIDNMEKFCRESPLAVALDESIIEGNYVINGPRFLVIKTFLLNSLSQINTIIRYARKENMDIVFSDTYSSGLGILYQAELSAAFGGRLAMGFDTYNTLEKDILVESPFISASMIDLDKTNKIIQAGWFD